MKIGRNDPCPCGSGKKYKKCCGSERVEDLSLPEEFLTGTPLDNYQMLLPPLGMFYEMLLEYDDDRKELKGAAKDFERDFRPGEPDGLPDSLYLSWLYFDFRFGKTDETVCERFLKSDTLRVLKEPGFTCLRRMNESYSAFYEVGDIAENAITFTELATGKVWKVSRIGEPEEQETGKGDIWYVRFVGPSDDAYVFSAPYILSGEVREHLEKALNAQRDDLAKTTGPMSADKLFAESCKVFLPLWAGYLMDVSAETGDEEMPGLQQSGQIPQMFNTDNEPLRFCKLFFKIETEEGLKEKFSSIRNFDYDEKNRTWIWLKKGNKQHASWRSTSLGAVSIKRGRVVGETNSEERAVKLMALLKRELEGYISFEKMESRDLADMPPLTEKKRRKIEKEQEKLRAMPEVRAFMRQQAEDYYNKDWMEHPIPAFGNRTPLEAVKTAQGRRKVQEFLDDLESRQNARPDDPFCVDVPALRKRLGLT